FEEWVSGERRQRRAQSVGSFLRIAEQELGAGLFESAMDAARLALRVEPLSEPAVRLLMRAGALSGDSAGALAAHHDFAQRLESIGERPSHDLAALAERIRRQTWRPAAALRVEAEPQLVGRAAAHERIFATASESLGQG